MDEPAASVDLSGLHRELDRLKNELCRCRHEGTCIACRGFELLREQSQAVVAAASQPVLMQVAQEAAVRDLMSQVGGMQEKLERRLAEDSQLQDMVARLYERIQEDLGGADNLQRMLRDLFGKEGGGPGPIPPDDRPPHPG